MKTPMLGETGVIGMAAREAARKAKRREAQLSALARACDAAVAFVFVPVIKFLSVAITALALGALLARLLGR